ncbi:MAG: polysaccharide biosynthesis/export family protein [Pseudomonadota bacterium]
MRFKEKMARMIRDNALLSDGFRTVVMVMIIILTCTFCSYHPSGDGNFITRIENQGDVDKLGKIETILTVTPEKATLHPDYQVAEEVAVPYVPEYRIGPGDIIEIVYHIRYDEPLEFYRLEIQDRISLNFPFHPQFNTTVLVRTDGKVTVTLLGDLAVEGKTTDEVAKELNERYGRYLTNPAITVSLEEFNVKIAELKRAITTAPRGQSKIAPIAPDGRISFPIVGDMHAAGLTITQLEKIVNERYQAYVKNLHSTLILLEIHKPKFYIVGEVNKPGAYETSARTTLLECIAMGNGFTKAANLREVIVVRNEGLERPIAFRVDLESALATGNVSANMRIKSADIVYIPKTGLDHFDDMMEKIFTKGLYAMIPFSTTFSWNAPRGAWFPP